MVNPTFSLGTYAFANLRAFLENRPTSFIGLTPDGASSIATGRSGWPAATRRTSSRRTARLTLTAGLRYEFMTMPIDTGGRDSALVNLTDRTATTGPALRGRRLQQPLAARRRRVGCDRRRPHGGARRLRPVLHHQQLAEPDRHGHQPAGDAARGLSRTRRFPNPPFDRASGLSIRPVQWDVDHAVDSGLERQRAARAAAADGRDARLRRLARTAPAAQQRRQHGGAGRRAPTACRSSPRARRASNTAWTTIEPKSSDGDSWYRALIVEARRRWSNGWSFQSSYTWSDSEDTTQASTFFSDATNGTTSAFPEFIPDYNRGPSDFNAEHNWVSNSTGTSRGAAA